MAMGECSADSSLYRRTQRSSLQFGLRVGGHLALTDLAQRNHSELSHMACAVDDNTINIVVVIIIILLLSSFGFEAPTGNVIKLYKKSRDCGEVSAPKRNKAPYNNAKKSNT